MNNYDIKDLTLNELVELMQVVGYRKLKMEEIEKDTDSLEYRTICSLDEKLRDVFYRN